MNALQILNRNTHSLAKYLSRIKYDQEPRPYRSSKIVCNIGPACRDVAKLEELMAHGMNIACLNMSHGTHKYHAETVSMIRQAAKNYSEAIDFQYPVAIALETRGPNIRAGQLTGEVVELKDIGAIKPATSKKFEPITTKDIYCIDYITNSLETDNNAVSQQDLMDLKFGIKQKVDIIFASCICNAKALTEIRENLAVWNSSMKVISKIENHHGMKNIDEIIDASDGIMVARGDLGNEISEPKVVAAQKTIIARCNLAGKPVICATQMLDSMTQKPRPTLAEVSDIGNAVLDGADCVMLSDETAKGEFPVKCIDMMSKVCRAAENIMHSDCQERIDDFQAEFAENQKIVYVAAVKAAMKIGAAGIIVMSSTGDSAFLLSSILRPPCPVLLATDRVETARHANLYRGVFPFLTIPKDYNEPDTHDLSAIIDRTLLEAKKQKLLIGYEKPVVVLRPRGEGSSFKARLFVTYI